jgi:predicted DsbA family dithiol-disulfide isomerase
MIYVDIVSDTICPWCYIGKRRFERALALSGRNDVALSWRPFQLNPDMPTEGMTRDDYVRAKFGGGDRPRQIYQAIAESGREAGIEFQFARIKRTPNTVLSHRLIHWSAKNLKQDELVNELFTAYFEQGLDIGDLDTLVECAARAGLDGPLSRRYLMSDEGCLCPPAGHQRRALLHRQPQVRRLGRAATLCFRRGVQSRRAGRGHQRRPIHSLTARYVDRHMICRST